MSDSVGQSKKAVLKNAQRLTPPPYVTDKNVIMVDRFAGVVRDKRQGRNDRCACGSGKKFKVCCMMTYRPISDLSREEITEGHRSNDG